MLDSFLVVFNEVTSRPLTYIFSTPPRPLNTPDTLTPWFVGKGLNQLAAAPVPSLMTNRACLAATLFAFGDIWIHLTPAVPLFVPKSKKRVAVALNWPFQLTQN